MSGVSNPDIHSTDSESILWRSSFLPGHEACRLFAALSQWHLEGAAVFSHEGLPCRLDYHIRCDEKWQTLSVEVHGWAGKTAVDLRVEATPDQHWLLNGVEHPDLTGCTDVDLNFSPSTNLLPIRRLNLKVGQSAEVQAAWLRFPSFRLERLAQTYTRVGELTYRYESSGGKFSTELKVNAAGFVIDYPDIWAAEAVYENGG